MEISAKQEAFDLQIRIWRTRGARFNASRRLKIRDRISTYTLTYLGICAALLPVVQRFYGLPVHSEIDNHYSVLGIVLGIGVIILSLLEGQGQFAVRSEKLDRNAIRLGNVAASFRRNLIAAGGDEAKQLKAIEECQKDYEKEIEVCSENHDRADDRLFLAQHRSDPEFTFSKIGLPSAMGIALAFWIKTIWIYVV